MQAMQRQLLLQSPATGEPCVRVGTRLGAGSVRPAQAMKRRRQFPVWPPEKGSVLVQAGGDRFAVGPAVLKKLGSLAEMHSAQRDQWNAMQQLGMKGDMQEGVLELNFVDSATFGTILTCFRAPPKKKVNSEPRYTARDFLRLALEPEFIVQEIDPAVIGHYGDYGRRIANVTEMLEKECKTPEQANTILHALDFLQAEVRNKFGRKFVLHYAAVNPTIAAHLGKPYDELPQDVRAVVSRGAYDRLNSVLRHALMKPNFIKKDPPQWLPPFARETLQSKHTRTPEEIKSLLRKHDNWRFLEYVPGSTDLQELDLSDKELTSLPPEIGHLIGLTELWLHYNKFELLPPEIGALVNLVTLDLSNNKLSSLPSKIGLLANLESLWLDNNKLTSLPPEIGHLIGLKYLRIEDNQLTSLPPKIGGLTGLEQLYLDNNKLTSLSSAIGLLASLEYLRISRNKLRPDELTRVCDALPNCIIEAEDQHPDNWLQEITRSIFG